MRGKPLVFTYAQGSSESVFPTILSLILVEVFRQCVAFMVFMSYELRVSVKSVL